jgi:hypothetical protein
MIKVFGFWGICLFILSLNCISGCSNSSNKDCRKGHLIAVESCKQKSEPGFQNSGAYYVIAKGVPKEEFCASFINSTKNLDSEVWTFPGLVDSICRKA